MSLSLDKRTLEGEAFVRLALLDLPPRRLVSLLQAFSGRLPDVFRVSDEELLQIDGWTPPMARRVLQAPELSPALQQRVAQSRTSVVTWLDDDYPVALREIADPPALLFVRGTLLESDRFSLAVVGTRKASSGSRALSERLSADLASAGLTVVSGGARGIDMAAHRGALRVGGRTIAVLGSGIDVVYPPEAVSLFQEISQHGAVVSEFPHGVKPDAWRFPMRNRIVCGMAMGLLVVQAPLASGAMVTAGLACDQGKPVFAVPGSVEGGEHAGCHRLIRDGAQLVEQADEILQYFGISSSAKPRGDTALADLTELQRVIVTELSLTPTHLDTLIERTGRSAAELNAELLLLEMNGVVRRHPGGSYVRVP